MYMLHFIYSYVDGYLGSFHLLALMNDAAVNRSVHISLWDTALIC